MFIYNVTTKMDWSIHDDWLLWMKNIHMPELVATGCFTHTQLVRLLDTDDHDGPTYAAQYFAESKAGYNRYIEQYALTYRQKTFDMWGNKISSFRSLMQIVQ